MKGEIGGCEPDLPNTQTLLLLNAATLDPTITARLNYIDGLYKIREEDID